MWTTSASTTVVVEDGEEQHHEIPGDGAPHAPSSDCGCAPERLEIDGRIIYGHFDQEALS